MKNVVKVLCIALVLLLGLCPLAGAASKLSDEEIAAIQAEIGEKEAEIVALQKEIDVLNTLLIAGIYADFDDPAFMDQIEVFEHADWQMNGKWCKAFVLRNDSSYVLDMVLSINFLDENGNILDTVTRETEAMFPSSQESFVCSTGQEYADYNYSVSVLENEAYIIQQAGNS